MQVEHVAWVSLTSGRAFKDQADLAVSDSVLGQIVVHDQRVHAVLHKPLAHSASGIRAMYWFAGLSAADELTMMVNSIAL